MLRLTNHGRWRAAQRAETRCSAKGLGGNGEDSGRQAKGAERHRPLSCGESWQTPACCNRIHFHMDTPISLDSKKLHERFVRTPSENFKSLVAIRSWTAVVRYTPWLRRALQRREAHELRRQRIQQREEEKRKKCLGEAVIVGDIGILKVNSKSSLWKTRGWCSASRFLRVYILFFFVLVFSFFQWKSTVLHHSCYQVGRRRAEAKGGANPIQSKHSAKIASVLHRFTMFYPVFRWQNRPVFTAFRYLFRRPRRPPNASAKSNRRSNSERHNAWRCGTGSQVVMTVFNKDQQIYNIEIKTMFGKKEATVKYNLWSMYWMIHIRHLTS